MGIPFVDPTFLSSRECVQIRAAMDRGAIEAAEVLDDQMRLEEDVRRAASIEVDAATLRFVEDRLDGHRAAIAASCGATLTSREGASFLRYPEGGFYKPHRDRAWVSAWPDAARRQVAIVLFLNSARAADVPGAFDGGVLRLFLEAETTAPIDVHPREGTLVAFPADLLHEVTPVRDGTRDSIVDWFY